MSVTELRVHGVGGAAPDALLGTTSYRQVWGDRIAGFYAADTPQRGRRVEAYCWGGMTSRSSTRVLWLLLFPFMLVNLAGWTCSARTRADRWAFAAHRACGRLAALALTLNLMLVAALAAMDIWAFQFGGRPLEKSPSLWKTVAHRMLGGLAAGPRVVVGAAVVVVVLLVLWFLSRQARNRYEEVAPADTGHHRHAENAAAMPDGVADPQFFNGAATVRRLAHLHVSAGLAWLAWILAYVSGEPLGYRLEIGAAALLACSILLLVVETGGDRTLLPLIVAASLLACVAALCVGKAQLLPDEQGHLKHMHAASVESFWLIVTLVGARLPVMTVVALLRRSGIRRGAAGATPSPSGPRWPAAPLIVAVLGMLSVNIAGIGGLVAAATALGPDMRVFDGLRDKMAWLTLAPLSVAITFVAVELIRYAAAGYRQGPSAVIAEYAGRTDATPPPAPPLDTWRCNALPVQDICDQERERRMRWVRSIARGRKLAGFGADARYLFIGLTAVAVVILAGIEASIEKFPYKLPAPANSIAVTLAGLIPIAGMALLRYGWSRRDARRWLGVLWDVGTFWPRSFHPFGPPCYAERAVPDLQRRIRWLGDNGERVLVVAHSQGSVLAAVALAQKVAGEPTLVTFGCPLTKLYGWAFPAYVHSGVLGRLRNWRNFWYATDYVGGAVGQDGVDLGLPDPESAWYVAGEPMPRIRRHTGYWSDEAMWREIDRLAAEPHPAPVPA